MNNIKVFSYPIIILYYGIETYRTGVKVYVFKI